MGWGQTDLFQHRAYLAMDWKVAILGKKAMGFALARLQAQRGQAARQNPHKEQTRRVN